MSTINGESQPIIIDEEYSNNGGIALFSTNAGGTVSGGSSEEGSYNSIFRYKNLIINLRTPLCY